MQYTMRILRTGQLISSIFINFPYLFSFPLKPNRTSGNSYIVKTNEKYVSVTQTDETDVS